MTTSVFFTNLVWVLLVANWVAQWNWREKFADFGCNYLLQAFLALLAVHVLWLLTTDNIAYALYDLQKKLPLFCIPLVVLTTAPPTPKETLSIGVCYVGTVLTVTIIGLVRFLTIDNLPYRQIVPYISHIRFGLNVCLTLVMIIWVALKFRRRWLYLLGAVLALWLLGFLMLIRSYTSFVVLLTSAVVLPLCYRRRMGKPLRATLFACVFGGVLLAAGLCSYYCHDYYHLRPLSTAPLASVTPNGNPYLHLNDSLIENGNYIHHYICREEMRRQWSKCSALPFDSATATGWTVYPTLLRYLNGLGVTKDSLGMTHLSQADVAAIERGIANPVYLQAGPRKMVYMLCYEFENFRHHHSVQGFSMLQRIELWRNAFVVLRQHPLWGVGTGDVPDLCQRQLKASGSFLAQTGMHTHSQYLNFLLAFGLVGFATMAIFFVRAIVRTHSCRRVLFAAFLCTVLVSFISEDTLETLAGITFTAFFFALLSCRAHPGHKTT